jgi:hypothetical protein
LKKLLTFVLCLFHGVFTTTSRADSCIADGNIWPMECGLPTGGVAAGANSRTDSSVYTGLVWQFGNEGSFVPLFQLGFRSLNVKTSDNVNGADINVRIKYDHSLELDSARLSYVGGERNLLGNLGFGYSFLNHEVLATGGVEGAYIRLSSDYLLTSKKFNFFGELNTLNKPTKYIRPSSGDMTCTSGTLYTVTGSDSVPTADILNGKTCLAYPPP